MNGLPFIGRTVVSLISYSVPNTFSYDIPVLSGDTSLFLTHSKHPDLQDCITKGIY
jgi:hypothetical protein